MRISTTSQFSVWVLGLVLSACAFTPAKGVGDVLLEAPHGAVFLQQAEDGWFRTAHPFELSTEAIATMLRGVYVQRASTEPAAGEGVFSDTDTEFLSPLLHTGLSKATRHQVVRFRVVHTVEGQQETTGGFVYIQGRLLHLTLTHYRAQADGSLDGDRVPLVNPNPTGLSQYHLGFRPEAIRRSGRHEQLDVIDSPPFASTRLPGS